MSLVKKLRFKEPPLYILQLPEASIGLFDDLTYSKTIRGKAVVEHVLLFADFQKVLNDQLPKLLNRLADDALLWIAYPKKSGSIKSDLTRDEGWQPIMNKGYEPVTQVAIDDDWSVLRFRKSAAIGAKLRDILMAERKVEGIDFVNRKVTLPKDVAEAFKPHKELLTLFKSMSFSHQKEYVEAIVTAKKPETRMKRINKTIEMLEKIKASKK